MKFNLKKLQKLEATFTDNPVCQSSLQEMITLVLQYTETGNYALAPANVKIALDTLKELKVLEDTPIKEVQQLNS